MPSNMFSGGSSRMAHNNDDLRERWELRREIAERAKPPRRHHNSHGYADEPNDTPALRAFIGEIDPQTVAYEEMPAVIRDLSRKLDFVLELKIELAYKFQDAKNEVERRAAMVEQNAAGAAERMIRGVRHELYMRQSTMKKRLPEVVAANAVNGSTLQQIRDLIQGVDPEHGAHSTHPLVLALIAGSALIDVQIRTDILYDALHHNDEVKPKVSRYIDDLHKSLAQVQRYTIWLQAQLAAAHGLDLSMPEEGNE